MALTVGELVATIDADPAGLVRGLSDAELALHGFSRDADGRLRDTRGRFVSVEDAARQMGHGVQAAAHEAGDGLRHLEDRASGGRGALSRMAGAARGLTGGLGGVVARMAPLLAQLGSAVPLAAGLATMLAQVAPAASIAATGILMAVSASIALKIGMSGVGDAVKAAMDPGTKPDALAKALKGLAPPARAFVLQLRAVKAEFDHLKLGVQSALFAGLAGTVHDLGLSLLPVLRTQLTQTAGTLNIMAKSVADTAAGLADSGILGRALKGANAGLRNLQSIPAQIVDALGVLGAAAAPTFARLTAAAGQAAQGMSERLDAAFDSGALGRAINTAVSVLKQLGGVVADVGSIVGSVFKAAAVAGGSWLGVLGQITGAMAKAFASPAVQAALGALFGTMRVLGQTVAPLVSQALAALGPVLVELAPPVQALVKTLGAALKPVIGALGPVLTETAFAVGQLADAVSPLLPIIGGMIAQLGPLLAPMLTLVGQLFGDLAPVVARLGKVLLPPFAKIVSTIGSAFTQLAPVLDDAVQQFGKGLLPVIDGLGDVIMQLVTQNSKQFMDMFKQLLPVIPVLIPVVVQLAKSIGQILTAVAPLLPQLMLLTAQFITQFLPAIIPLIPPLAKIAVILLRLATAIITKVVIPALKGLISFIGGMRKLLKPGIDAVEWLTKHISGAFEWLYDHLVGHSVIPDMVRAIVSWLKRLPVQGVAALASLPGRLAGVASSAAGRMVSALASGVRSSSRAVGRLPGMARSALGNLGSYLYRSGQSLIKGFADGILSMAGAVKSAAGSVLSRAKGLFPNSPAKEGPFSGGGWTFHSGVATGRDWAAGLISQQDHVAAAAGVVMGAAAGRLAGRLAGSGSIGGGGYGGGYAAGAAAMSGGAGGVLRIEFAGPAEMKRLIRGIVKNDGHGDVQIAFGR